MEYVTFTVRVPRDLSEPLDREAAEEYRSRSQMIVTILRERYVSPKSKTADARASPRQKRGQKQKAALT
jgi:metal-responsive CopG/Arc/MetJ family transcriptional regulator